MSDFRFGRVRVLTILTSARGAFFAVWVAIALLSVAWAVATPIGGSPDEPQHIVKAASVARGEFLGKPTDLPAVTRVTVPAGIADSRRWTCHVFNPDIGASCQGKLASGLEPRSATTSAGLYNPTYYAIVGWPSLFVPDSQIAIILMRTIGALVTSLFFALGFVSLRKVVGGSIAAVTVGIIVTPMVAFLAGAVNPNALEVATGFCLLTTVLAALRSPGVPSRRTLVVIGLSGALLANDRGISPAWMFLIAVIAIAATPRWRLAEVLRYRSVQITLAVLAVATACAAWWLLSTGTLGSMGSFSGAGTTTPRQAFLEMIARVFDPGLIGVFGWLSLPAPALVFVVWTVAAGAATLVGLAVAKWHVVTALVISIVGLVLVPAITQALAVESSGYIWQGRYGIIGLGLVVTMAAVACHDGLAPIAVALAPAARRLLVALGVLIVISQAMSLYNTERFYVLGITGISAVGFLIHGMWQPPGTVLLWLVAVVAGSSLLFLTALAIGGRSEKGLPPLKRRRESHAPSNRVSA